MTAHFQSKRSGTTDDFAARILAMFGDGKPRTSEDVATRLQIPVNAAGRFLAQLYMDGRIRKAEVKHGYQIWEMAK